MAEKFSLDDILAEVDSKRARRSETEKPPVREEKKQEIKISAEEKTEKKPLELDDILGGKKAEPAPKPRDFSTTAILNESEIRALEREAEAQKKKKKKKAVQEEISKKRDFSATAILNEAELRAQERQLETEKKVKRLVGEISEAPAAEKPRKKPAPVEEKPKKKIEEKPVRTEPVTVKKEKPEKKQPVEETEKKKAKYQPVEIKERPPVFVPDEPLDEKEQLLSTGSIEIDEEPAVPELLFGRNNNEADYEDRPRKKKKQTSPEEKRRKLEKHQLRREIEADNPDDLIDAINPLEVRSKAASDFDNFMAGDTIGLAGNDLKELAEGGAKKADAETAEIRQNSDGGATRTIGDTAEAIKTFVPQNSSEKERRSNTALVDSLNKAIAKKREQDLQAQHTLSSLEASETTGSLSAKIVAPENGLNIDYQKKIIQDTGVVPLENPELNREKINDLVSKRKRKIRDFVLEDIEEEEEAEEEKPSASVEFDSYDTTGQIWSDLCESHKGLKTRFILLFILTVIAFVFNLICDMGSGIKFELFGNLMEFLYRKYDATGFIYFNLIIGILGAGLCSTVIIGGLSKLIKGKADCDSICSLISIVSFVMPILHLTKTEYIQTGQAYLYIVPALAALLFNTLGKLIMIVRAKRNFRFVSGDSAKYSATVIEDQAAASALTKGVVNELPFLATMRKTEFLTDFLKNSYCTDRADRLSRILTPASAGAALLFAVLAYFVPNGVVGMENNIYWASSVFCAMLAVLSPLSMMFVVNLPLTRAGKALAKCDSVVLGYAAVEEYAGVNSVMIDAVTLFPSGSTIYSNIKHCKQPNSINSIALDQAIILAASLAIKSGSVLSNMFKDMINDKEDILAKVDNCVYEDNMGILGWFGNKRMIMGNREQMKHHDIKIPDLKKVKKYSSDNTDTIYLAVGGEVIIMFFVELIANSEVKRCLQALTAKGVSVVVKTTDSIITVSRIAEVFDISPEFVRVLPYSLHSQFLGCTKYVSRGDGALSCNGTFTSFASALIAAKKLIKDINLLSYVMLSGAALGALCVAALGIFAQTALLSPSAIVIWNAAWFLLVAVAGYIRRY